MPIREQGSALKDSIARQILKKIASGAAPLGNPLFVEDVRAAVKTLLADVERLEERKHMHHHTIMYAIVAAALHGTREEVVAWVQALARGTEEEGDEEFARRLRRCLDGKGIAKMQVQ